MRISNFLRYGLPVLATLIVASLASASEPASLPQAAKQSAPVFRSYQHPVTTWVPPYAVAESKAQLTGNADIKDTITHLALQFWIPTEEGGLSKVGFGQVDDKTIGELRDWGHANGIRVLLCVYNYKDPKGWDWSLARAGFVHNRTKFIQDLITEMERLQLDGIDIDVEGNDTYEEDKAPFVAFMTELSKELHDRKKHLTVDTFQAYKWNAPNQSWWPEIFPLVDALASMGYGDSGLNAPDWRSYDAQKKAAGANVAKLQLGMPSDKAKWRSNTVQEQLDWVSKDATMGVAIWDAQFPAAEWRTKEVWAALKKIRGEKK